MNFGNHVDSAIRVHAPTARRMRADISATLFLTPPEDYDGGELLVEDTYGVHSVEARRPATWCSIRRPACTASRRLPAAPAYRRSSGSRAWCATTRSARCCSTWTWRSAALPGRAGRHRAGIAHRLLSQPAADVGRRLNRVQATSSPAGGRLRP